MKRRHFIGHSLAAGLALSAPVARVFAAPSDYSGRFLVTLQAEGGWDVTSLCDPKTNTAGKPDINTWAKTGSIQTAGNLQYAPVANNAQFFGAHFRNLLVINGVDSQTNSHSTGVVHHWSGRNSVGYPSLTALFAAANAPQLPLAYLNFGGYGETAKLIRYTRLDDASDLLRVLTPNIPSWDTRTTYQEPSLLSRIQARQQTRLNQLRSSDTLLPRQKNSMDSYYQARANAAGLADFAAVIPAESELKKPVKLGDENATLLSQMQLALLAFSAGVGCSADLVLRGFDTHDDHDNRQQLLLSHLADALDYFWNDAARLGIADRITLVIGSDFGRTPRYNSAMGKDHWPIGSTLVMQPNAPWGNRVVGLTDATHNALAINPTTLKADPKGTLIYPKHVHKALRHLLGLNNSPLAEAFAFGATELLPIFS